MRPLQTASTTLETASTTRYKFPNSATSILRRQKGGSRVRARENQWWATEKGRIRPEKPVEGAEGPPRRSRRRTKGAQRSHPLQVHYVLRGPIRRDPAHLFSSAWQAGESKRADRKRRRLYFYSRSAISRSAAHLRNGGDTSVTVVTSNYSRSSRGCHKVTTPYLRARYLQ